jgi:hypothetical protein
MKKILVFILLVLTVSANAQTQSKTYPATLKKYMEATGTIETFNTAIDGMMGQFKSMYPSVPDDVWTEFAKEFSSTSIDDLVVLMAPIYEKHLTEADLNEMVKFYNTPIGKKLAAKTPLITQESMTAGQAWGMKIAEKVQAKMKEKGY